MGFYVNVKRLRNLRSPEMLMPVAFVFIALQHLAFSSMDICRRVVQLALKAHNECWIEGGTVSDQTKKSQKTCTRWQELTRKAFKERFSVEKPIGDQGSKQKIDLVDKISRVAYELKASKNNVHMEIYRDVFKILVHNLRLPDERLKALVFIAPEEGRKAVADDFLDDVKSLTRKHDVEFTVEWLPKK